MSCIIIVKSGKLTPTIMLFTPLCSASFLAFLPQHFDPYRFLSPKCLFGPSGSHQERQQEVRESFIGVCEALWLGPYLGRDTAF